MWTSPTEQVEQLEESSGVLSDRKMNVKIKKVYRTVVRPVPVYGAEALQKAEESGGSIRPCYMEAYVIVHRPHIKVGIRSRGRRDASRRHNLVAPHSTDFHLNDDKLPVTKMISIERDIT